MLFRSPHYERTTRFGRTAAARGGNTARTIVPMLAHPERKWACAEPSVSTAASSAASATATASAPATVADGQCFDSHWSRGGGDGAARFEPRESAIRGLQQADAARARATRDAKAELRATHVADTERRAGEAGAERAQREEERRLGLIGARTRYYESLTANSSHAATLG